MMIYCGIMHIHEVNAGGGGGGGGEVGLGG